MKKAALLLAVGLIVGASPASAAGYINLGWTDCAALGPVTLNESFTCTTNNGNSQLFASFQPPVTMPALNGADGTIDIQTDQAILSQWWHMESGGCRQGRIVTNWDFLAGPFTCLDPWSGFAASGLLYTVGNLGPNTARVRVLGAVPSGFESPVSPPDEYYACKVLITHAKTLGAGSCDGCLDGACFVFTSLTLTGPGGIPSYTMTSGPQTVVSWRGGGATNCTGATPTRPRTWGQIKGLYR